MAVWSNCPWLHVFFEKITAFKSLPCLSLLSRTFSTNFQSSTALVRVGLRDGARKSSRQSVLSGNPERKSPRLPTRKTWGANCRLSRSSTKGQNFLTTLIDTRISGCGFGLVFFSRHWRWERGRAWTSPKVGKGLRRGWQCLMVKRSSHLRIRFRHCSLLGYGSALSTSTPSWSSFPSSSSLSPEPSCKFRCLSGDNDFFFLISLWQFLNEMLGGCCFLKFDE